ncbi:hypothetical protein [Lichenibacterium minor]|uniref:hypothetical protein n=1 Tax=Lichenibacterium minor TaxID=2316528 RepID=UPI0013EE3DD4|nr:hypothetical protein [Lichenibacterium minor]
MAIKFVDIEPDDAGKPKRAEKAEVPATREPEAERPGVSPAPYAKPAPKKRGWR